jgi:Tol biopolymer transport system component
MIKKISSLFLILITIFLLGCVSEVKPDFYLLGEQEIFVNTGEEYIEPGYYAFMNEEDISDRVVITSTLDTYYEGEYIIKYLLTINDVEYSLERTVNVEGKLIKYFNQDAPGLTPKKFAEGIITKSSTSEFSCTFSPDYRYFFFTRRNILNDNRIYYSEFQDSEWTLPTLSPISEDVSEFEPYITNDGKYLYFGSKRDNNANLVIYRSSYDDGNWSTPVFVDNGLNDGFAMYISVADSKNIYYTTMDGIYVMKFQDGEYLPGEFTGILGAHSFIAPDESFMLVDDSGQNNQNVSIYISLNIDGVWQEPIKLPESINDINSNQICASISPDMKFLFFSRFTSGAADIYWVDISILDEYIKIGQNILFF